jgi:poly(A) polymerase
MKIAGDWLDHPGTQALMQALEGAGHKALFVGGCVRNALLGEPVSDVDISTDATPETVSRLAESAGFKPVPTGIDHGTVTVVAEGKPHEVTTFRRDVETDGRRAVVAFSDKIEEDAQRRDFTMNALYADRHGTVIDPLNGLPDLQSRRVRFVGDPETRIREDYLRILRFFRFHAAYGDPDGGIDPEGLAACAALADGIETISKERIGAEVRKLLTASYPVTALAAMAQSGVLARILPGADIRAIGPLTSIEADHDADIDWLRRLAALGGDDPVDRLRLSRTDARDLAALRDSIGNMETPAVLAWRLGFTRAVDALLLRAAVLQSPLTLAALQAARRGADAHFPVTAADLMPALQGEALGLRLKQLEQVWLASDLILGREDLLKGA